MGALAATVLLTGCFDGPSAPANEADTNQLAVAAASKIINRTVIVKFSVPKRTNSPRNDGIVTATRRCREALPNVQNINIIQAVNRTSSWHQSWLCTSRTIIR